MNNTERKINIHNLISEENYNMSEVRNKKKIKIRQRFRKIEMSEWVQSCKGADHHSRYCFDLIHSFQNHPNRTFTFTSSTTYRARKYKPTHEQDTEDMRENRHKRMEHLPFLLSIESTKPNDYTSSKSTGHNHACMDISIIFLY